MSSKSATLIVWPIICPCWLRDLTVLKILPTLTFPNRSNSRPNSRRSTLRHILDRLLDPWVCCYDTGHVECLLQARADAARMQTQAVKTLIAVQTLDLVRHLNIGRFRLAVCVLGIIGGVHHNIVVNDRRGAVPSGRDVDNARMERRAGGGNQYVLESHEERKVSKMISSELGLETVFSLPFGRGHHASVLLAMCR